MIPVLPLDAILREESSIRLNSSPLAPKIHGFGETTEGVRAMAQLLESL
jgi:hypothetical protein